MEPEFDKFASDYSNKIENHIRFAGKNHDFFVRDKIKHLNRLLEEVTLPKSQTSVLDVGCGVGLGHNLLAPEVGSLTGVDISELSLEQARLENPEVLYQGYDGHALPFEDHSFDCAFAICVMHHVPPAQWSSFMSEMNRVVRPGGKVIIIEHNPFNPMTQAIVNTCELDVDAVLLTPWRTQKLMRENQLGNSKVEYTLFTPFEHPLFRRLDELLWWLPLGAQYVASAQK